MPHCSMRAGIQGSAQRQGEEHTHGSHASGDPAHAGHPASGDRRLLHADRAGGLGQVRNLRDRGQARLQDGDQLQPYWADFNTSGGSGFGDYLAKRGEEVSQALLSVTDARAAASGRPTIIKAYGTVRGSAARHVETALPQVGELVLKYAP